MSVHPPGGGDLGEHGPERRGGRRRDPSPAPASSANRAAAVGRGALRAVCGWRIAVAHLRPLAPRTMVCLTVTGLPWQNRFGVGLGVLLLVRRQEPPPQIPARHRHPDVEGWRTSSSTTGWSPESSPRTAAPARRSPWAPPPPSRSRPCWARGCRGARRPCRRLAKMAKKRLLVAIIPAIALRGEQVDHGGRRLGGGFGGLPHQPIACSTGSGASTAGGRLALQLAPRRPTRRSPCAAAPAWICRAGRGAAPSPTRRWATSSRPRRRRRPTRVPSSVVAWHHRAPPPKGTLSRLHALPSKRARWSRCGVLCSTRRWTSDLALRATPAKP